VNRIKPYTATISFQKQDQRHTSLWLPRRGRYDAPMTKLTSEDLWGDIQAIGSEDGTADQLPPAVIAKLIEMRFVTLSATGIPWLTEKGERAYVASESGDGEVPELDE
jgi:hypothetical protein